MLCGNVCWTSVENKIIANIFSQDEIFNTDYESMKICLLEVKEYAEKAKSSVAIPYGMGCGIANGKWNIVYKIIKKIFEDSNIECILYKLERSYETTR